MRRTLTKEEWGHLHHILEGVDSIQIVVLPSAPPEPVVIGDRFICSPDYNTRLRFTVDLIGQEELFPPMVADGFHRFGVKGS